MPCTVACPDCSRIRLAGLEIVGEGGVEALSLGALAERTGMPGSALACHYRSAADCLYEIYEEMSRSVFRDFEQAFEQGSNWPEALALGVRRALARMSARPAEARLCFVEVLRGDRELRRRREAARQRMVELFVREHHRRRREGLPEMQMELLIGAAFQIVAAAIAEGRTAELPGLEAELIELAEVFEPVAA